MSEVLVGTNETDYIYNALGQLIKKSAAGGTTLLMYDEAGHILGEYTGALIQETIWMGDSPVATLQPSGSSVAIYYVHTDHLGTPRKITRPSDNGLMWRWDPDTFGSLPPNTNPAGLGIFTYNLRFPGQYSLGESGLYYNYFRDYDPQMGRYIESDPIGPYGGVNTYAYALGGPTINADRLGLQSYPGYGSSQERSDQIHMVGAWNAWLAHLDATEALNDAVNSGLSGIHNGPADAFRHCTWSCLMTKDFGAKNAELVGAVHELNDTRHGQPMNELKMDTANNGVGRQCGLMTDKRSCIQRCMDKLRGGLLFGLDATQMRAP